MVPIISKINLKGCEVFYVKCVKIQSLTTTGQHWSKRVETLKSVQYLSKCTILPTTKLIAFKYFYSSLPGPSSSTCKWVPVGLWRQHSLWDVLTKRVSPGSKKQVGGEKNAWCSRSSHVISTSVNPSDTFQAQVFPDLLSPFSMTANSSSGVLLDNRCLLKKELSLQIFAMLSFSALLAWSTQTQRKTHHTANTLQFCH